MTRFFPRAPTFLFCVANKPKAFDERDTDKCVGGVAASGDFGEMKIVGGAKNARPSSSPTIAGQTKLSSDMVAFGRSPTLARGATAICHSIICHAHGTGANVSHGEIRDSNYATMTQPAAVTMSGDR